MSVGDRLCGGETDDAAVEAHEEGQVQHEQGQHAQHEGDNQLDDGSLPDLVLANAAGAQLLLKLRKQLIKTAAETGLKK